MTSDSALTKEKVLRSLSKRDTMDDVRAAVMATIHDLEGQIEVAYQEDTLREVRTLEFAVCVIKEYFPVFFEDEEGGS